MTVSNIQHIYFSEAQATGSDQTVPSSALFAIQTLDMIQKAKQAVVESVQKTQVATLGSKKVEEVKNSAVEDAYIKLQKLLTKAIRTSSLQDYLLLLSAISALPDDILKSPMIQEFLQKNTSALQQITLALSQFESLDNDTDGGKKWLEDMVAKFQRIPVIGNTFSGFLAKLPQYIAETTVMIDGKAVRVWRNNENGTGPNGAYFEFKHYKNLISFLLATGQKPGAPIVPNPMYEHLSSLTKEYTQYYIEKLKKAVSAGEAFMILMTMFDDDYSSQESALAGSTDMLTGLTNSAASPLLALVQDTKNFNDPAGFANAILLAKEVVASSPQFEAISGSLSDAINGIKAIPTYITVDGKKVDITIGALLDAYTKTASKGNLDKLAEGIKALTSPAQGLINNVQQIGALFTGLSKQVSTHLSIVTNQDDSVIKVGRSAASPDGPLQQFMGRLVHNQKTN